VFTTHEYTAPPRANVTFVRGDVREFAEDFKADAGDRNVWLLGGGNLVAQFADAGLLDELIVSIVPVVLGEGKRVLPVRKGPTTQLELLSSSPLGQGMVELRYRIPSHGG
jgi:dihydrofolate reductase